MEDYFISIVMVNWIFIIYKCKIPSGLKKSSVIIIECTELNWSGKIQMNCVFLSS